MQVLDSLAPELPYWKTFLKKVLADNGTRNNKNKAS